MPCGSQSGGSGPSRRERELGRVLMLLDELRGKPLDPEAYREAYSTMNYSLDELTAGLCARLEEIDVSKQSLEMQIWWRDHQVWDARRRAEEEAARLADEERNTALSKLTPRERQILGLK